MAFRSIAMREYRSVVSLIEEYLRLTERASTDIYPLGPGPRKQSVPSEMHLFDMLRSKRLFPSNTDLTQFAARVLPNMTARRFDKMSRGDIAVRIIEYLETLDKRTRQELEASMREAMSQPSEKAADRKSFFTTWENIIKGIQF